MISRWRRARDDVVGEGCGRVPFVTEEVLEPPDTEERRRALPVDLGELEDHRVLAHCVREVHLACVAQVENDRHLGRTDGLRAGRDVVGRRGDNEGFGLAERRVRGAGGLHAHLEVRDPQKVVLRVDLADAVKEHLELLGRVGCVRCHGAESLRGGGSLMKTCRSIPTP